MTKAGRKRYRETLVPVTVSIGKTMARTTRIVAAQQGISRSELVRRVLEKYLGNTNQGERNATG